MKTWSFRFFDGVPASHRLVKHRYIFDYNLVYMTPSNQNFNPPVVTFEAEMPVSLNRDFPAGLSHHPGGL